MSSNIRVPKICQHCGAEFIAKDVFNQNLVILDLENQTLTEVANVPLHAKRYFSLVLVEDGKVYVSIEAESEAHVYQVDFENATVTKGVRIAGKTI